MSYTYNSEFMKRAIELSRRAIDQTAGGPFGCVIVKDGKIIGEGGNEVTLNNDPTAHAEIVAIRNACENLNSFQLEDCEVYASCEPCPMCLGAIYWARPKVVFYANTKENAAEVDFDDHFIYNEINLSPAHRSIPMIHQPEREAAKVFENWSEKMDKIKY